MTVPFPKLTLPAALAALALGCATEQPKAPAPLPKYSETATQSATATVQSIDQATRRVALKEKDGNTFEFTAGPQVRNLDQIQVGDLVAVTYTETFTLEVKRGDGSAPSVTSAAAGDRAAVGEKPAGSVARVTTITAAVLAVDKEIGRVTVQGPQGNTRVIQVKDPKKLESVKVGDMVVATYSESLGIAVEKVPAAK
jgi:Cu/Ag efflux protein CusF